MRTDSDLFMYAGYAVKAFEDPRLSRARKILYMYHPHIERCSDILLLDIQRHPEARSDLADLESDRKDRFVDRELALADLIVCSSEFTVSTIASIGVDRSKVVVIPYGISPSASALNPKATDTCKFLFVGSGIHRKGIHILCDAWNRARLANAQLTLVCRYIEPWLRARAEAARVELLQGVTQSELEKLYTNAHVFVLPSLVEGFGYVYLEALARGCFCIGTSNTGLPDLQLTLEAASVVPAGDIDALTDAISEAFRKWRMEMLNPAEIQRASGHWTWERFRTSISDCARGIQNPESASL